MPSFRKDLSGISPYWRIFIGCGRISQCGPVSPVSVPPMLFWLPIEIRCCEFPSTLPEIIRSSLCTRLRRRSARSIPQANTEFLSNPPGVCHDGQRVRFGRQHGKEGGVGDVGTVEL